MRVRVRVREERFKLSSEIKSKIRARARVAAEVPKDSSPGYVGEERSMEISIASAIAQPGTRQERQAKTGHETGPQWGKNGSDGDSGYKILKMSHFGCIHL